VCPDEEFKASVLDGGSIPYSSFGGSGPLLHFAHANGYPPGTYRPLLELLNTGHHVVAMHMRPLWPKSVPEGLHDWSSLSTDIEKFLEQQNFNQLIGAGHSMGATATLRLALDHPGRFRALVLIDPVLFPPFAIRIWDIIYRLGLAYFHPLVRGALHRKDCFTDLSAMFTNYRRKAIFRNIDDAGLWAYVDAVAKPLPDGKVELAYPPAWEARIYATSLRADMHIWRNLAKLKPPTLIIRGGESDAFRANTARRMQSLRGDILLRTIPNASHLVPMEYPQQTYEFIDAFLREIIN
jgi:pimeloyl-ACP methyl ester carboxylesterase